MAIERAEAFAFGSHICTVLGPVLQVGSNAPDFEVLANDLSRVRLSDNAGKAVLISVVPSLETSVCDAQTRRFNEEISKLGDDVVGFTISTDLPFTQKRWCGNAGVERVVTLSDHFDMSFGLAYGTYAKELRLEQRAVFVVDKNGKLTYVEYVPVGGQQPNYEAALAALAAAAK